MSKLFKERKFEPRSEDLQLITKGFLGLHDLYERIKFDLSNAQACSHYMLNVSEANSLENIIFFYHEIGIRYAEDFNNFSNAAIYLKKAVEVILNNDYEYKNDDLAYFYGMIGKCYYFDCDYNKSLDYYVKAKTIIETTGEGSENMTTIIQSIEANKIKLDE